MKKNIILVLAIILTFSLANNALAIQTYCGTGKTPLCVKKSGNTRIYGKIDSVTTENNTLTIKIKDAVWTINTAETKFYKYRLTKATINDAFVGKYVVVYGSLQSDNTVTARKIIISPSLSLMIN